MFRQINFYGKWTVAIIHKGSYPYQYKFQIQGSPPLTGGGTYLAPGATTIYVNGPVWNISFLWAAPPLPGPQVWQTCELSKQSADFLDDTGLVVTLGVYRDVPDGVVDQAFDQLVVRLTNTDPALNSFVPITHPNFTYERMPPPPR
jgi:hypothetical protein